MKIKTKIDDINEETDLTKVLFDFIPKRIDENKRQLMSLIYYVYRYQ